MGEKGPTQRKSARRGSLYIAVLGVATFVAVVGLTALAAVRVQQQAASLKEAEAQADVFAQSVIDLVQYWIAADANWRTTYTNDTWTTEQVDGPARFNFKLVDEADGDLANDPRQSVRLYGRATIGTAVRMYSVLLQPAQQTNLLTNADMEAGTAGWSSWNCSLVSRTDQFHGGAKSLLIAARGSIDAEAYELVTGTIQSGKTYYGELWARMLAAGTDRVTLSLKITTTLGVQLFTTPYTTVGSNWTKVSGTLTPTWTGTLTEARWRTFTYPSGGLSSYFIDDAYAGIVSAGMNIVPGSWRREVSTRQVLDQGEVGGTPLP